MKKEVEMANNVEAFSAPINEDYDDDGQTERQPFLNGGKTKYRYSIEIDHQSIDLASKKWEFPGWGTTERIELSNPQMQQDDDTDLETPKSDSDKKQHKLLGEFRATAIAGNDITSSCLYVSGLCAQAAKKLAPISLLLVVAVLYVFRGIYGEVGTALPLNGGAYNVLLNSTTKLAASIAACLTLVSYVATAVVSASSAVAYGANVWDGLCPGADPGGGAAFCWAVVILITAFALLNLLGLKESATVALGIFIVHMATMCLLIVMCIAKLAMDQDFSILKDNWGKSNDDVPKQIFFGYCQALLGVSGFETSSNYIEEQKPGVFPKTLRNMWIAIAFFNPVLSFLAFCLLTESEVLDHPNDLLAAMASKASGRWLNVIVSADAFFVLSGAVLTSYVGITGLVRRMSLDRCMPQILLRENRMGSSYLIVIGFCIVTSLLYIIVQGNVNTLAGVYTIAFLGVMSLFALGNMLLKYKRAQLHREVKTAWISVIIGFLCVVTGLIGVIAEDPKYVRFFVLYFGTTLLVVMMMFARKRVLKVTAYFLAKSKMFPGAVSTLRGTIKDLDEQAMVFFTKTDELEILNKAVLYVRDNEITGKLKIVHVYEDEAAIPKNLEFYIKILDRQYPKMQIDLILVKGKFDPVTVNQLSNLLGVPKNFMFITCPSGRFPHNFKDLGGLRLITH